MSTFEQKLFSALHPKRTAVRKRRRGVRRGRLVDAKYMAWLATQPPLVGSGPVTIHHVRRFGEQKNDRRTVPLPAEYHLYEFGSECIERLGKQKFQELFGVDLEEAIIRYNQRYDLLREGAAHCPECGSHKFRLEEYDYGVDRDTGYHDAGQRIVCRECGARTDIDDVCSCRGQHVQVPEVHAMAAMEAGDADSCPF